MPLLGACCEKLTTSLFSAWICIPQQRNRHSLQVYALVWCLNIAQIFGRTFPFSCPPTLEQISCMMLLSRCSCEDQKGITGVFMMGDKLWGFSISSARQPEVRDLKKLDGLQSRDGGEETNIPSVTEFLDVAGFFCKLLFYYSCSPCNQ